MMEFFPASDLNFRFTSSGKITLATKAFSTARSIV